MDHELERFFKDTQLGIMTVDLIGAQNEEAQRLRHRIFAAIAYSERIMNLIFICEHQAAFTFTVLPGENRVSPSLRPLMPRMSRDVQPEVLAYLTHRFALVHQLLVSLELQNWSRLVEGALQQFVFSGLHG